MKSTDKEKVLERITSRESTRYQVIDVDERRYVHCAADTIMYSMLVDRKISVDVASFMGSAYRVEIDPDKPPENLHMLAVTGDLEKLPENSSTPSRICSYINFFRNLTEFEKWRSSLGDTSRDLVRLLNMKEAYEFVRELIRQLSWKDESQCL